MKTTKIYITPAQADVVRGLLINTPWFRKAKRCVFSSGEGYSLEFELTSDSRDLLAMVSLAPRFGFSARTCRALGNRIRAAVEHTKAVDRVRKAS